MKRYLINFFAGFVLVATVSACGGVTDVGNPTGTTQVITGQVDLTTLPAASASKLASVRGASQDESGPEEISVLATNVDSLEDTETQVDEDGFFSVEIEVGSAYEFDVLRDGVSLGLFSFKRDGLGNRGGRLRFIVEGDDVDLGRLSWESDGFRPENEPFEEHESEVEVEDDEEGDD